jgi:hypothetical protein
LSTSARLHHLRVIEVPRVEKFAASLDDEMILKRIESIVREVETAHIVYAGDRLV